MFDWDKYQKEAYRTTVYLKAFKIEYPLLGLVGETGEIAEKIKKWLRRDDGAELDTHALADEIGDCLWYLAALATDLDMKMSEWVNYSEVMSLPKTELPRAALLLHRSVSALTALDMFRDGNARDVFLMLDEISTVTRFSLEDCAEMNLEKLRDREQRGVIQGNGDTR
jgi:NTP pyrophosphatase (non-canonical NTP hydrolase)